MNQRVGFFWLGFFWFVTGFWAHASVQLDIPPRRQWDNNNGYCGECSIQQCALYYGAYVSQYTVRQIIDPTQQQQVLVPYNSGPIFDALRLNYAAWDSNQTMPQYQNYLVWAKSQIQQKYPVIIDVYIQGGTDPDYDHIIPAIGFTSVDTTTYHAADTLVFYDNYTTTPFTRTFDTLSDTRAMNSNGATNPYCIPRDTDYGCAVTGIKDDSGATLPVSVKVDRWDEPNLSQGQSPARMNATIQVNALTSGTAYVLLRYNDYHNVPTSNYLASAYSSSTTFVATNSTQILSDTFTSDATVIYRCVPALLTAPAFSVQLAGADVQLRFATQTNAHYGVDYRNDVTAGSWTNLTNHQPGTGGLLSIIDAGVANASNRFYRVYLTVP